jgi:hypothetical protein
MINKAIAVYLDNNDKMVIEFSWLWKTWKYHKLDEEYDLVVYYNPLVESELNKFPGIKKIPMDVIRLGSKYKFLNSHYFCLDEFSEPLKKYEYIMKTDCDVFLTQNLKGYTPTKILVGLGGYYNPTDELKVNFIKKVCADNGVTYQHINNVGATFFGSTDYVLNVVKHQAIITEKVLLEYFKDRTTCPYSGFHVGISSMIAGEVTVNGLLNRQHIILYALDSKCWKTTKIGSDVLHIHAWHSYDKWSKHDFFKGLYSDWEVNYEDRYESAANYCHWVATNDILNINI